MTIPGSWGISLLSERPRRFALGTRPARCWRRVRDPGKPERFSLRAGEAPVETGKVVQERHTAPVGAEPAFLQAPGTPCACCRRRSRSEPPDADRVIDRYSYGGRTLPCLFIQARFSKARTQRCLPVISQLRCCLTSLCVYQQINSYQPPSGYLSVTRSASGGSARDLRRQQAQGVPKACKKAGFAPTGAVCRSCTTMPVSTGASPPRRERRHAFPGSRTRRRHLAGRVPRAKRLGRSKRSEIPVQETYTRCNVPAASNTEKGIRAGAVFSRTASAAKVPAASPSGTQLPVTR